MVATRNWFFNAIRNQPLLLPTLATACAISYVDLGHTLFLIISALSCLLSVRYGKLVCFFTYSCAIAGYLLHSANLSNLEDQKSLNGKLVECYGIIHTEPRSSRGFTQEVELLVLQSSSNKSLLEGQRILAHFPSDTILSIGQKVWIKGKTRIPPLPMNPKMLDRSKLIHRMNITLELNVVRHELTDQFSNQYIIHRWAESSRIWIRARLTKGIENTEASKIILAMFLGEKPQGSIEMMNDFKHSGTIHVFAVSGLHVMMIGLLFTFVFRLCGCSARIWIPLVITIMIFYAIVTGMRPPAMRATIMGTTVLLAILIMRKPSLPNSLYLSALIAMLWNTHSLFLPGFQLSYTVLIMIILTGTWWSNRWAWITSTDPFLPRSLFTNKQRLGLSLRKKIAATFSVSSSAWTGSSVLIWIYFGLITPIAIIASLPLMLTVFCLLATCCLSLTVGSISDSLAVKINQLNAWNATCTHSISRYCASLPGSYYQHKPWADGERIVIYSIPEGGSACYISLGGGFMLDAANQDEFYQNVWPSLSKNGARLDSLVASHADIKHIQGLTECIKRFPIKQIIPPQPNDKSSTYTSLLETAREHSIRMIEPKKRVFAISPEATLEILYTGSPDYPLADDRTNVFLLTWHSKKILFLNDTGFHFEQWLKSKPRKVTADIIILSKHSQEDFINAQTLMSLNPTTIITSNSQTRDPKWKSTLTKNNIQLLHLNKTGAITITQDFNIFNLDTFKKQTPRVPPTSGR